ncbi:hypothetical protein C8Q77DRAFT_1122154 [Trametes polyzona]|nr:hypothetical protein C8Q77DRAFT_1122154 [Trametes polyzona]
MTKKCDIRLRRAARRRSWGRGNRKRSTGMDATNGPSGFPLPIPPTFPLQLPELPALDSTYGAILVGSYISLALYGINVYQLYGYLNRYYRRDGVVVLFFVFSTFLLETLHIIACIHVCYHLLVTTYFDIAALAEAPAPWSFIMLAQVSFMAICVAQCFFARRVYILRPGLYPLTVASILLSLASFALSTTATIRLSLARTLNGSTRPYTVIDSFGLGAAAISDILTTSVLIVVLKESRTGWRQTDLVVDRLISYSFNTGLLTVVFDILGVAFGLAYPEHFVGFAITIVGTQVYSNTLMVMLNVRESLFEDTSTSRDGAISLGPLRDSSASSEATPPSDVVYIGRQSDSVSSPQRTLMSKPGVYA